MSTSRTCAGRRTRSGDARPDGRTRPRSPRGRCGSASAGTARRGACRRHSTWSPARALTRSSQSISARATDARRGELWSPGARRTWSTPTLTLSRRRDRIDPSRATPGCAVRRRGERPLPAQRPPVLPAAGAGAGLLAGVAPGRAERRGAARARWSWSRRSASTASRMHQKVEDPRFLYWCDRLGLLVWGEMANAYDILADAVRAVHPRVAGRASAATTATPASSPGCRSTRAGACRRSPATRRQRHYVQALVPPDARARPDPARDRQRRLGAHRQRHPGRSTTTRATPTGSGERYGRREALARTIRDDSARPAAASR